MDLRHLRARPVVVQEPALVEVVLVEGIGSQYSECEVGR